VLEEHAVVKNDWQSVDAEMIDKFKSKVISSLNKQDIKFTELNTDSQTAYKNEENRRLIVQGVDG
jgi:hypothetical protein